MQTNAEGWDLRSTFLSVFSLPTVQARIYTTWRSRLTTPQLTSYRPRLRPSGPIELEFPITSVETLLLYHTVYTLLSSLPAGDVA